MLNEPETTELLRLQEKRLKAAVARSGRFGFQARELLRKVRWARRMKGAGGAFGIAHYNNLIDSECRGSARFSGAIGGAA